ncbi:hypothetical protein [Halorhodospira neutriphila]|uniref:hypothetical protein n=1 Tax=Halorhodospira neutriphila TaxID=168379 RepID=UPI001907781A|nr:hypothetical protein [Halorhodospira neutriphila]
MTHSSLPTNFQESLQEFEKIEKELSLPDWKIEGIHIWKVLRFNLFNEYRDQLDLLKNINQELPKSSKIRKYTESWKLLSFRNPFFFKKSKTKRIIISGIRKTSHKGEKIHPIASQLWDPSQKEKSLILEKNSLDKPNSFYGPPSLTALRLLGSILGTTMQVRLTKKDKQKIKGIEEKIFIGNTKSYQQLENLVYNTVKNFKGNKYIYSAFLDRAKPEYLYTGCSYGLEELIAAAKELDIKTIEFQHGAFGRGHLGYDYSDWSHVPYFPDEFLAFGPEWFKHVSFPRACKVHIVGYKRLEESIAEQNETHLKRPKQLLILSQPLFTSIIIEVASDFSQKRPDWEIIIRPHPKENSSLLHKKMKERTCEKNWRIEKNTKLEKHLITSSVALGLSSTALIESLLAGCRAVIIDNPKNPGYFNDSNNKDNITKVKNGEELSKIIDDIPLKSPRGFYATPSENILQTIEERHSRTK